MLEGLSLFLFVFISEFDLSYWLLLYDEYTSIYSILTVYEKIQEFSCDVDMLCRMYHNKVSSSIW